MKPFYLLEGMAAYVRGAVRRGWRWWERVSETILTWAEQVGNWWTHTSDGVVIPDPLWVLPVSTASPYAGTWTLQQPNGEIWGPFRYDEGPQLYQEDPVKRAYDMVAETNRVLTEVFGGPWDLPPDLFDLEDWEGLLLADYNDVIVRGED